MNRYHWIVCLLVCICSFQEANAQEVIYAPYEKFDIRSDDFSVVGKVTDRIYTYRASNEGCFLDAYNDSMEKVATVVLDFFPKKIYQVRFINYSEKMLTLYQAVESGKVVQYAALLDGTGRLLKGPIQLNSAKTGMFGPNRDYFSSAVSDDKKQVLVYSIDEKGNQMQFSGVWLDDQLNSIVRSNAAFAADNDLGHGEGILDDSGNFYLPVYTPTGAKNYTDQLWILSLNKGMRKFYTKEVPLNSMYATSTYMKLDNPNRRIYIGGFYSDKRSGNYEGVLFTYYDMNDSSFHNSKMIAFDDRIRSATGERNKRRAFNDYQVRQMIIKKDGGFVLLSEDFFITTRNINPGWGGYYSSYYGGFGNQMIREYNYNDIFALSYDGAGANEWYAFIRKAQYSQEDGGLFSSYALINTGGSLGFLFNDFNTNRSRIQLATLDGSGKVDMRSLAAGSANDPDWLPRSAKQVGLREMVIPCLRKKQITFAKIVF